MIRKYRKTHRNLQPQTLSTARTLDPKHSTKLRNTRWVIGVAVYTGKETKIQMNMSDTPNKVIPQTLR